MYLQILMIKLIIDKNNYSSIPFTYYYASYEVDNNMVHFTV